ncbi:MAG: protein-methionine-sulfoxide reductase heme-binding subunit MsrQ [Rhodobacteraceae bacterium]|nr:protein-methionine-sulfoxide reductase heme-binding subunit MsrQ [Paracoccaceae bacterium]
MIDSANRFFRRVPAWTVYIVCAAFPLWLLWKGISGTLGVDPVKEIEHRLGLWALKLLVLGLCITPVRRFTGLNLIKFRRAIGLSAFYFLVLHLLAWLVLDMGLLWRQALADIAKRPYITIGTAGLLLLVPLALTSNNWSIRRLGGARWQRLHKLVYPAVLAGAVHYLWLVKAWPVEPFVYLGLTMLLLGVRAIPRRRPLRAVNDAESAVSQINRKTAVR